MCKSPFVPRLPGELKLAVRPVLPARWRRHVTWRPISGFFMLSNYSRLSNSFLHQFRFRVQ
jgi:hypothetical protein